MADIIRIRVFEVDRGKYVLKDCHETFEEHIEGQFREGYAVRDMVALGVDNLRVVFVRDTRFAEMQRGVGTAESLGKMEIKDVPSCEK